jgi:hypothetical protein
MGAMSVTSGNGSNVLALDYPQCHQEKVISNTSQDKEENRGINVLF